VHLTDGKTLDIESPAKLPDAGRQESQESRAPGST
jgi:hypothetical protein